MDNSLELKAIFRQMLLPIPSLAEEGCLVVIKDILTVAGINEEEHAQFLKVKYDEWQYDGIINPQLAEVIQCAIKAPGGAAAQYIADTYFENFRALIGDPFLSFELSIITLSHLKLILPLTRVEKMSAAKIAKVIWAIDNRLSVLSWKHIQRILVAFKLQPELIQIEVEALYNEDEKLELEYFADADIEESAWFVGEVARKLQFKYDAGSYLQKLSGDVESHLPYLQILHYQCLIAGFYDHVFPILYEFNPRGNTANWLFNKWDNLVHTSNPMLNNAKAVHLLDENWAKSRKQNEYEQATVLVEMLKGLDEMGFSAAQELSSWIRSWLVRYIRLNSTTIIPIPDGLVSGDIQKIASFITAKETNTYGILEQRFIDVVASYFHVGDQWRSRGLGDSVNANNNSKRKLGDCDFQNVAEKRIVAYEAHGGKLSKVYYEGHIRTLKRTLQRRVEELETVADISEWTLQIIFIAYNFETHLPSEIEIDGLKIKIGYRTFAEIASDVDYTDKKFLQIFGQYFINILNNRRTPTFVRDKITALLKTKMDIKRSK